MGAEALDDGIPDRRRHGELGTDHASGIAAAGMVSAKLLGVLNRAAHAHGTHQFIHRFRKWSAREAHAWGMTKRRNAAAGTDDNAAAPR